MQLCLGFFLYHASPQNLGLVKNNAIKIKDNAGLGDQISLKSAVGETRMDLDD